MAVTQFLLTGLAWSLAACEPLAVVFPIAAHGLSALSAANYRPSEKSAT